MTREEAYNVHIEWIEKCEQSDRLTEWEQDFVQSVKKFLTERKYLTPRQVEVLERIYADKTE